MLVVHVLTTLTYIGGESKLNFIPVDTTWCSLEPSLRVCAIRIHQPCTAIQHYFNKRGRVCIVPFKQLFQIIKEFLPVTDDVGIFSYVYDIIQMLIQ